MNWVLLYIYIYIYIHMYVSIMYIYKRAGTIVINFFLPHLFCSTLYIYAYIYICMSQWYNIYMYIYTQISFYPIYFAPLHIHICQLVLLPICPPVYIYVVYKHNGVRVDRDILLPHLFCSTLHIYIYIVVTPPSYSSFFIFIYGVQT